MDSPRRLGSAAVEIPKSQLGRSEGARPIVCSDETESGGRSKVVDQDLDLPLSRWNLDVRVSDPGQEK